MSDTPETDAFLRGLAHEVKTGLTLESFARRLERERDEARREIESLHEDLAGEDL